MINNLLLEMGDVYEWGVIPAPKLTMRGRPVVEESLKRVRINKITCGMFFIINYPLLIINHISRLLKL